MPAQLAHQAFKLFLERLAVLLGMQAMINIGVAVRLLPAKGMTLPFISYGGSSLISLAFGMGCLIAVTRKRPRSELYIHEQNTHEPTGALAHA